MRKSLITGAIICSLSVTSVYAGTLADPLVESDVATAEKSRNSAIWIIPAIILVAVVAVVASNDSGGGGNNDRRRKRKIK